MEAHVNMMRALRAENSKKPWFKKLFKDYDNRSFSFSSRKYDVSELLTRGVTMNDFLLAGVSWSTLRALGYRITDMKALGGTMDDIASLGVTIAHLVDEHDHVTPEFILPLMRSKSDLTQWTPAELFKMGFTFDQLLHAGLNEEYAVLTDMMYFYKPTMNQRMRWKSGTPAPQPVVPALGEETYTPPVREQVRDLSKIKVDVSNLRVM